MRNNLVIKGAPELPAQSLRRENTKELVIDHINSIMGNKYTRSEVENCIDRAHIGGKQIQGKPRPIFCNLLMSTFVDEICDTSRTLISNIKFERQYTPELNERRNKAILKRKELKGSNAIISGYVAYPATLMVKTTINSTYKKFEDF